LIFSAPPIQRWPADPATLRRYSRVSTAKPHFQRFANLFGRASASPARRRFDRGDRASTQRPVAPHAFAVVDVVARRPCRRRSAVAGLVGGLEGPRDRRRCGSRRSPDLGRAALPDVDEVAERGLRGGSRRRSTAAGRCRSRRSRDCSSRSCCRRPTYRLTTPIPLAAITSGALLAAVADDCGLGAGVTGADSPNGGYGQLRRATWTILWSRSRPRRRQDQLVAVFALDQRRPAVGGRVSSVRCTSGTE